MQNFFDSGTNESFTEEVRRNLGLTKLESFHTPYSCVDLFDIISDSFFYDKHNNKMHIKIYIMVNNTIKDIIKSSF